MKTILIVAITADGFIAKTPSNGETWNYTSKGDRGVFVEITKHAGVIVMGSATYKTIGKPLPDRLNIIYSRTPKKIEGVEVTKKDPEELLKDLESRGYNEVAIIGGAQIFTLFMERKLVDKVYLTIEPLFFGKGVNLFTKDLPAQLEFKSAKVKYLKKQGTNTVILEYDVKK